MVYFRRLLAELKGFVYEQYVSWQGVLAKADMNITSLAMFGKTVDQVVAEAHNILKNPDPATRRTIAEAILTGKPCPFQRIEAQRLITYCTEPRSSTGYCPYHAGLADIIIDMDATSIKLGEELPEMKSEFGRKALQERFTGMSLQQYPLCSYRGKTRSYIPLGVSTSIQ